MSSIQAQVLGEAADFGRALRGDLSGARALSVAVAFAKESALRELDVETWSREGHAFNLVAGTDFALTELDLLKRFKDIPSADCRIYHSLSKPRIFHPKLYIFDKDASRVVYVGSSNFTRGGLRENIEANVRLEGPADAPEIQQAAGIFAGLFDAEYSSPITEDDERRYKELQLRLRATQTYPTFADYARQMQVAESLLLGASTHRLTPRDFDALRAVFEAEARVEHAMEPEA